MAQRLVIRHEWVRGTHIRGDPEVVAKQFDQLVQQQGALHLDDVIAVNQPESAPLHTYFEWNESAAAHLWQLHQAGHVVRSLRRITVDPQIEEEGSPERVYIPHRVVAASDQNGNGQEQPRAYTYIPMTLANDENEQNQRVLENAITQIERMIARFRSIAALGELAGELDDLLLKYR